MFCVLELFVIVVIKGFEEVVEREIYGFLVFFGVDLGIGV